MARIRAYTTVEQSRKLAEILPLESADMYYPNRTDVKYQGALPIEFKYGNPLLSQEIAAWSLAALLGVLPNYEINNFGDTIQLDVNREALATEGDETLLDLIVNMIIHLHELKML